MPLTPGTRLGPYEIAAQIGVGGMGEVYRATDTNLKRQVAIKVLPETVAADPDRLARFQREAEVLAALNHPNIAHIHGLEKSDPSTSSGQAGTYALVMELVEGEDLSQRIARGAMSLDEALPVAKQIVEALEAAHEQGIIHRDLKPANIKIRDDGTVKVLDFGLAKAIEPAVSLSGSASASMSPTITTPAMTQMGMILGTAAYMAPEQAKGRAVDRRADIWAFGVVLFEMLTGMRAFPGDDTSEVLAGVIKSEPDWRVLPAVPPLLEAFLRQCLQKDPRQRLGDIRDMRLALEGAFDTTAPHAATAVAPPPPAWRRPLPIAAAALVVALGAGLTGWLLRPAPAPRQVTRFSYALPSDLSFRRTGRPVLAVAPDGGSFAYNTPKGIYLRSMDELEARLIPGTEEDASYPFFSPDGQWIGYWAATTGELKRVAVSGGVSVVITDAVNPEGVSWGPDDQILFGQPDGIRRVAATGGASELVIPARDDERVYGPQLLPDGDSVLFAATKGPWDESQVVAESLSTGDRVIVVEGGGNDARYLPTGHLVYVVGEDLRGVGFDVERLSLTGGAVSLLQGLSTSTNTATAHYGVSEDGTLVYRQGNAMATADRSLVWVSRTGAETPVGAPERQYESLSLSPDGTRAAVEIRDTNGRADVWVSDLTRGTLTRVTTDPAWDGHPLWSPDGRRVVFTSDRNGKAELFWKAADGSGEAESLLTMDVPLTELVASDWSPDGATLFVDAHTDSMNDTHNDVGLVDIDRPGRWAPLLQTPAHDREPAVSPDGRWLAYASDETEVMEVYVQRLPGLGDRQIISVDGGRDPSWSADNEILYLRGLPGSPPDAVMRVPLTFENGDRPTLRPGRPEILFDFPFYTRSSGGSGREYDVSADGQRLLVIKPGGDGTPAAAARQFVVVENWFEELNRLVPTD